MWIPGREGMLEKKYSEVNFVLNLVTVFSDQQIQYCKLEKDQR